jgi:hypothetical protein
VDIRLLFPNEYVSAADLIEWQKKSGKSGVTLTILSVAVEDLKTNKGKEAKPIIHFAEMVRRQQQGKGPEKKLVLNKTNAKAISRLYGHETDDWKGKRITLFPTQCEAFGETVDCVRVMASAPQSQAKPASREPGDDFPPTSAELGFTVPVDAEIDPKTGEMVEPVQQ